MIIQWWAHSTPKHLPLKFYPVKMLQPAHPLTAPGNAASASGGGRLVGRLVSALTYCVRPEGTTGGGPRGPPAAPAAPGLAPAAAAAARPGTPAGTRYTQYERDRGLDVWGCHTGLGA